MFWRGFLEVNREGPKDSSGRPRKTLPEEPEDSSGRPRKTAGRRRKTLPEDPEDSSGRLLEDAGRLFRKTLPEDPEVLPEDPSGGPEVLPEDPSGRHIYNTQPVRHSVSYGSPVIGGNTCYEY